MKYIINIEQKQIKEPSSEEEYCHIISTKDAIITKIITQNGTEEKDINDSVKKGDTIISGDIKLNEEIKSHICANGTVYGTTWYTVNITIPKTYDKTSETGRKKRNILFKVNNKSYKLFRPRFNKYREKSSKITNIFGLEIYLVKEFETVVDNTTYNEEELELNINKLVEEKMQNELSENSKIITQKVLKKNNNDSTIDIELFIVAEEIISEKIVATIDTEVEE